jgi:hypothetical protein
MRSTTILIIVSLLALVAVILPSILFLAGAVALGTVKGIMLAATVIWFVTATPWMWRQSG